MIKKLSYIKNNRYSLFAKEQVIKSVINEIGTTKRALKKRTKTKLKSACIYLRKKKRIYLARKIERAITEKEAEEFRIWLNCLFNSPCFIMARSILTLKGYKFATKWDIIKNRLIILKTAIKILNYATREEMKLKRIKKKSKRR